MAQLKVAPRPGQLGILGGSPTPTQKFWTRPLSRYKIRISTPRDAYGDLAKPPSFLTKGQHMDFEDPRLILAQHFAGSKFMAHETIFAHRRDCGSAAMHAEMLGYHYSNVGKVLFLAFRGGAKSTLAEEVLTLAPIVNFVENPCRNFIIVGTSETRAAERLEAIKYEFETNENLLQVFGDYRGDTWTSTRITLKNNVCIQAVGQDQSMRGVKYLAYRPDFWLLDDIEDEEHVATPEARLKFLRRYLAKIRPAASRNARWRMNATPLDAEALAVTLSKSREWLTKVYPIKYIDDKGSWKATWPGAFPLPRCDEIEQELASKGQIAIWQREYMVQATAMRDAVFKEQDFVYRATPRTFQAVYAMYDPARSTNKDSAHTGKAVWSWDNNRLIVWECGGAFWQPDEIIADAVATSEKYDPILIGFEVDGLNEFLMQPLRVAASKTEHPFPYSPVKAPRSKLDFIRGLQPFFAAHEVIFAGDDSGPFETLAAQLKNFPTGRVDAPNALAYAPLLRPGMPVFEALPATAVIPPSTPARSRPLILALNASRTTPLTTGIVCQFTSNGLAVHMDYVLEGGPGLRLATLVQQASMDFGRRLQIIAPPDHFKPYDTIGLRSAVAALPAEVEKGGDPLQGRDALRRLLETSSPLTGRPRLVVSEMAHWTLRALSGGYHHDMNGRQGLLRAEPKDNAYATLMQALEAVAARAGLSLQDAGLSVNERHYAEDEYGRPYLTSRPTS